MQGEATSAAISRQSPPVFMVCRMVASRDARTDFGGTGKADCSLVSGLSTRDPVPAAPMGSADPRLTSRVRCEPRQPSKLGGSPYFFSFSRSKIKYKNSRTVNQWVTLIVQRVPITTDRYQAFPLGMSSAVLVGMSQHVSLLRCGYTGARRSKCIGSRAREILVGVEVRWPRFVGQPDGGSKVYPG